MTAVQVTTLAELPDGSGRAFTIGRQRIALFRVGDELFAIDDTCSHADASLSAGEFEPDELCVECPLHGSRFDVRSGAALNLPAFEPVASYRVYAEGETIFVEFPT